MADVLFHSARAGFRSAMHQEREFVGGRRTTKFDRPQTFVGAPPNVPRREQRTFPARSLSPADPERSYRHVRADRNTVRRDPLLRRDPQIDEGAVRRDIGDGTAVLIEILDLKARFGRSAALICPMTGHGFFLAPRRGHRRTDCQLNRA